MGAGAKVRVGFIGAGKVGCSLARYLRENGAELAGFFSRTHEHAQEAAAFTGGEAFNTAADAALASDVTFLTCTDAELPKIATELAAVLGEAAAGKTFAHCSGALAADVLTPLREAGAAACSAHPLYAVSSRFDCWQELGRAWFTLEGDETAVATVEALLSNCGNHVVRIPASEKVRYHAAAVMASNLVVGLYQMASDELVTCGFTPDDAQAALAPLFLGNAEHIAAAGTRPSLTGPAARGDQATIDAHLSCLSGDAREVYRQLTEVLYRIASL